VDLTVWDDEAIAERGPDVSLLYYLRKHVEDFLELPRVANFILGMVILLCVSIFQNLHLPNKLISILGWQIFTIISITSCLPFLFQK
jgi:hypothetical protein